MYCKSETLSLIDPNDGQGLAAFQYSPTVLTLSDASRTDSRVSGIGSLTGLFLLSFLAATILPAQSELGLAGLIAADLAPVWLLIAVASLGNTLGSVVNWLLGRGVDRFSSRRWFPVTPQQLDRASNWYRGYGKWSLLMSWAPVIGDPLTLAAGVLREPFWSFLALVAIAKTVRYLIVAAITLGIF
ncbi:DedA family protein [Labrenzia polysiphoniae]|uniref:DedA family protein n=1 Tax=Roseibium polysiphoniae TaxID=2571221 RepID=A0ABR9CF45_9HYPH|nr:DedA family protein [Roseibium polysiphoniae]